MKLMVIDGNSVINRAFYGIRPLTTKDGLYTHAVFGFLTTLLRLKEEEKPDALCVTFDVHAPTFRHKADAAYKATRKPMPEELRMQMPVLKDLLDALNIPRYELAGWEADDLIGTVSRRCEAAGWECVAVTGDKDSLQLITPHTKVKLIATRMGQTTTKDMTEQTFTEEYGFAPIHMIDLKALMGDSSDNISGVAGIGEKTATDLIRRYGSIDALYAAMPDVEAKPAAVAKLAAGEADARHSYWLATIVTDAPLAFRPEDNLVREPSADAYPLFLKLEFTKLIEKFGLPAPAEAAETASAPAPEPQPIETEREAKTAAETMRGRAVSVCFSEDFSATAFACGAAAWILDRGRFGGDFPAALALLLGATEDKSGHGVKDIQRALLALGVSADGWAFDAALAAYLLDATAGSYDLDRLCVKYCGFRLARGEEEKENEQLSLLLDPEEERKKRETRDRALAAEAAAVGLLRGKLEAELKEKNMYALYESAEMPLCRVLAEMERAGCGVDRDALRAFGEMLDARIKDSEQTVYTLAGEEFNINSPRQLGEILFEKLKLPHGKKTKLGWSTNADVLDKLRGAAPVVDAVLEYRQYAKLKSTYADGLLKAIDADGRVRTRFQMTVTATGRLSSAEPNLQNIPTRTDLGSEIRRMFVPAKGCVLVDADYSQIELRLLAHMAGDAAMREVFLAGGDFHTDTAAKVFGVPREAVTPELRRRAKAVNFGIVYGISAFSLSQDIGVSVAEAKEYMDAYFATFPAVQAYMTAVVEKAKETGYVETLFHRRRDLPELKSSNFNLRAFGERVALNMPIQGTAADVMKLAMIAVWKRLKRELPAAKLVLQVHDELIVECPEEDAEACAKLLTDEMEHAADFSVPLPVEAHWGANWLAAKG
ncbi:MAG: DNA polymerase I [Oscillibacter sp.]|nr:DNA polymerase I [Oscillibacter sp.]